MSEIDSLSIQIKSDATDSSQALNSLVKNLSKLGNALNKIDTGALSNNFKAIADGINQIKTSVSGIDGKNLENLATIAEKTGKNFQSVAKSAKKMSDSVNLKGAEKDIQGLAKEAEKISKTTSDSKNARSKSLAGQENPMSEEEILKFREAIEEPPTALEKMEQFIDGIVKKSGQLAALGGSIGQLSGGLSSLAAKGDKFLIGLANFDPEEAVMDFLKLPTKILPVLGVVEDKVRAKIDSIKGMFKELGESVEGAISGIVRSFQKVVQRVSFTLLRKAINAAIKDIDAAMQSLAQSATVTGKQFNSAMSSIVSNTKWVGASIVAAFSPIISAISPIIDALISKLVAAIRVIGMFFAALTGKGVVAVAKKNMTNFGAATDKAAKSAKKLRSYLLGIDELNVFEKDDDDKGGGGGGADNPYEWEEIEVPDWMKDLADRFKKMLEDLIYPFKEAWDRVGAYVKAGFKYMIGEVWKLLQSFYRDFIEMWHQEATVRMFEDLLRIIGDIEYTVGNLAKRFREAWDEGRVGLHIFEAIRDIFATLIHHVRNVTLYMREWSDSLNFRPLLTTFEHLLRSLNKVADFIGGVFEDVMERVILRHIKFMIEEGLPHLNHAITNVVNAFDFDKIRDDLTIVEDAFARLTENIDVGVVNAFENVGKALARWTNSEEFTKFMEAIASIMDRITPERVEKLFTAIGTAILNMVKAVANFVSSEGFQKFLDNLANWFDKVNGEQLAKLFEILAGAIVAFKFTAFIGNGFKNFLTFLALMKMSGISNFTKAFSTLTGVIKSFGLSVGAVGRNLKAGEGAMKSFSAGGQTLKYQLDQVSKSMTGFEKAVSVVAGIAIEFASVTNLFEDITVGAEDMGASIVEAILGAASAWAMFSLAFNSTGIGAIITAVVALGAAIVGVAKGLEQIETQKAQDAFDAFIEKTSESKHSLEDYENAMKEAGASMGESFARMHDSFQIIQDDRYSIEKTIETIGGIALAMQSQRELTDHEIAELGRSFENLKEQLEEFVNASYDAVIQQMMIDAEYLKSKGQWNDEIAKTYAGRLAELEIARQGEIDANNELVNNAKTTADEYVNASQKYKEAVQTYGEGADATKEAARAQEEAYQKLIDANANILGSFDGIGETTDEFQSALETSQDKIDEFAGNLNLKASDIDLDAENIGESFNSLSTTLGDAVRNMSDEYNTMSDSHKQAIVEMETAVNSLDVSEETKQGIIAESRERIDKEWQEYEKVYATNLNNIQEDVVGLIPELISSMEDMDLAPDAIQSNINKFVDAVFGTKKGGFQEQLKTAIDEAEINVVPYGQDAAKEIVDSIFNVETFMYGVGTPIPTMMSYTVVTLTKNWNSIIDNVVKEAKGNAEEKGKDIDEGLGIGIEKNSAVLKPKVERLFNTLDMMIHDNPIMPFGSPNLKTIEYGKDIVNGFNQGIDENSISTQEHIMTWMESVKESFDEFFSADMWQPLFDSLLNDVVKLNFETFRTWFTEEAMTPWWQEDLLPWFAVEKWDDEIFNPIDENIKKHVQEFIDWWKKKISKWFAEDVEPWFALKRWTQYGKNMQDGMYAGFKGIVAKIGRVLNGVVDEFNSFISSIETAINSLIDMYNSVAGVLGLPNLNHVSVKRAPRVKIPAFYDGGFVPMGDPKSYSLFAAGENGVVEMVGNVGGHPAVASGDEITGIKAAVEESGERQREMLATIASVAQMILDKDPVVFGDRAIAEAANRGQSQLGMAIIS